MLPETTQFSPDGLYLVRHDALTPRGLIVLVPPFAEEKKAAQRAVVEAARAFASSGFTTWRFDFRGTGDSAGEQGQVSCEDWLADLCAVMATARAEQPALPLTLVGLRFGAALAWLAAEADGGVDQLVLWEPVTSGASYMRQNRQRSQIRKELTAGEGPAATGGGEFAAFDFDGFAVSSELHRGLAAVDLAAGALPACRRVLTLQISGSSRLKKPLEDLHERARAGGLEAELDNVAVEAFWSAIGLVDASPVAQRTLAWLDAEPVAASAVQQTAIEQRCAVAPGVTATPVVMPSGDQSVVGVLYEPAGGRPQRAVVLLHGWSGYRIGPAGLLTTAARAFAAAGYAAFSFDFRGRGESDWEVGKASLNSMIRDAERAVAYVTERTGAAQVTLLGLCSGSEVALAASLSDARVDSLALWSAPIFSGNFDLARRARRSRKVLGDYGRKLLLRETWAKLLSGRLNWRLIARAAGGGRSAEDAGVADKAPDTATQMEAFAGYRGRLLFIYGGNDPETPPSRDFYRSFVERTNMPHHLVEVAGANHNFYSLAWHDEVIGTTLDWLAEPAD